MIYKTHLYRQLYKKLLVLIILFTFYAAIIPDNIFAAYVAVRNSPILKTKDSPELTIIEQNYEQAKIESRKQNKLLLIDFYPTWCGPCKQIDRSIIFAQMFNANPPIKMHWKAVFL